jgi:hypothetical protein
MHDARLRLPTWGDTIRCLVPTLREDVLLKLSGSISKERILTLTACTLLLFVSILLLASCGGGGGQTTVIEETTQVAPPQQQPQQQPSQPTPPPGGPSVREPALPDQSTTPVPPSPSETK